ncbi:Hypothetical_protein [Hexamita inflata]|uniref:Hypothetical_protein n=1 Tax=Hexamita inflata TaxID=28002 RepID=A0AA86VQK7_9EUKA|nr:Hypothetical protein HINF_LOCUS61353 [Hexamita inflata]
MSEKDIFDQITLEQIEKLMVLKRSHDFVSGYPSHKDNCNSIVEISIWNCVVDLSRLSTSKNRIFQSFSQPKIITLQIRNWMQQINKQISFKFFANVQNITIEDEPPALISYQMHSQNINKTQNQNMNQKEKQTIKIKFCFKVFNFVKSNCVQCKIFCLKLEQNEINQ